jgi:hypothetical protein
MQRDPKFVNNKDKFYGMSKNDMNMAGKAASHSSQQSLAKSKLSHAQKLDNFISNK